jgi:hypothetical protein
MCHHCIFLRGGLREENRAASIRHAEAAIVHGSDDAFALSFAGFSLGMDGHDRAAAFAAFEAALTVSPSSARTYIYGSLILGFAGEAERAIEWGERGMRLSPSMLGPSPLSTRLHSGTSIVAATRLRPMPLTRPSNPIRL